jgi:hypothetical protein
MPDAERETRRFGLRPEVLSRQRRLLVIAIAWYLPGSLILIGATAWAATRPGGGLGAALIGVSGAQVTFFAVVVVWQLRVTDRDLRRAGTSAGELVIGADGVRIDGALVGWADLLSVRVSRRSTPYLVLTTRRPGGFRSGGRRGRRGIRGGSYGVRADELAAAFGRFTAVDDAARPRPPVRDDAAGTVTFFVDDGALRAQRRRHLRSLWQLPVLLGPAIAGLAVVHLPLVAAWALAVLAGLMLAQRSKLAKLARGLWLGRGGRGRLLLAPEHLMLAGTDVPIPWSHIHGAAMAGPDRPGLGGTISCPDPDPAHRCGFRGRTIRFHIAESLYCTTAAEIGAAFGRYTRVAASPDGPAG